MVPVSPAPVGRGIVLWLTGLSGSGKSTLAAAVRAQLTVRGHHAFVIDGDRIRLGLCADLGFSKADRAENIRRVGEAAALFVDAGMIVLVACISPYLADRALVRAKFSRAEFLEIYCCAPLPICESRDVKGLYAKARAGLLSEFTGISAPYEPPVNAELCVDAALQEVAESAASVLAMLHARGLIAADCAR